MYHSKILNRIKLYYFLKFVVHELNSKMFKSEMVVLTERERTAVADIDVIVVEIDRRLLLGSIVGSCWDRPLALRSARTLNLTQQTEEEEDEQ
jgi:hypothetical protein